MSSRMESILRLNHGNNKNGYHRDSETHIPPPSQCRFICNFISIPIGN